MTTESRDERKHGKLAHDKYLLGHTICESALRRTAVEDKRV